MGPPLVTAVSDCVSMMVAGDEQALASVAQFGSDAELACHTEHQALNAFVGVVQRLASGMDGVPLVLINAMWCLNAYVSTKKLNRCLASFAVAKCLHQCQFICFSVEDSSAPNNALLSWQRTFQ